MIDVVVLNDFLRDPVVGLENHGINRRWLAALARGCLGGHATVREVASAADGRPGLDPSAFYAALDLDCAPGRWPEAMEAPVSGAFEDLLRDALGGAQVVVGFGLPTSVCRGLDRIGLPFVDFEVSPIRFQPRLAFDMRTNVAALETAGYLGWDDDAPRRDAVELAGRVAREAPGTLPPDAGRIGVVFGQANIDAALVFDGRIATFADFGDEVAAWADDLDHVLFRPHPYAEDTSHFHALRRILPDLRPTLTGSYQLLASQRIAKALALSSGIVDEAPYFGVEATRLFVPPRRRAGYPYVMSAGLEVLSPRTVRAILDGVPPPGPVPAPIDVRTQLGTPHGFGLALSHGDFDRPPDLDPATPDAVAADRPSEAAETGDHDAPETAADPLDAPSAPDATIVPMPTVEPPSSEERSGADRSCPEASKPQAGPLEPGSDRHPDPDVPEPSVTSLVPGSVDAGVLEAGSLGAGTLGPGRSEADRDLQQALASCHDLAHALGALDERIARIDRTLDDLTWRLRRPLWERILFCADGRPRGPVRRLLMHRNGACRGVFRRIVLHPDGRPHRPFARWMASPAYRSLPRAHAAGSPDDRAG